MLSFADARYLGAHPRLQLCTGVDPGRRPRRGPGLGGGPRWALKGGKSHRHPPCPTPSPTPNACTQHFLDSTKYTHHPSLPRTVVSVGIGSLSFNDCQGCVGSFLPRNQKMKCDASQWMLPDNVSPMTTTTTPQTTVGSPCKTAL